MMKSMRVYFLILLALSLGYSAYAQKSSRTELEKQRAGLLKEIEATQAQLASTKKDRRATLGELRALNNKLRSRQQLINTINKELGGINQDIRSLNAAIEKLSGNLDKLKIRYAQSIRYAYKHRESQNMLAFLFSANDFNDGLRRMQYLKKYRDHRKEQAAQIRKEQEKLSDAIAQLNQQKVKKGSLLETEQTQKVKLEVEQQETNRVIEELKGREGELMAQIKKNQQTAKRLENAIKAEIQREIEIARRKAAEEARRKAEAELARQRAAEEARRRAEAAELAVQKATAPTDSKQASDDKDNYKAGNQTVALNTGSSPGPEKAAEPPSASPEKAAERPSYKLSLTPEVKALSDDFSANQGRLPWPVVSGFISAPYGKHTHPVYKDVTIENNGIDIATQPGAAVRSVFSGTVIKVTNIDGVMIMISHGEYFTIYNNLSSASVQAGQKVSAKQAIGIAGTNSEGDPMVNFQIWKVGGNNSIFTVNPSSWIAK